MGYRREDWEWGVDPDQQDSLGYDRRAEPQREGEEVAEGEMYGRVSL